MSQADVKQYENIGIDYVCPTPKSHQHFSKARVDREVAAGIMRWAGGKKSKNGDGKHKRVAYYVDLHTLRVVACSVQRVRGNSLLHIKKAR